MLDIQTPSYFINPNFHLLKGAKIAVQDPATLNHVGNRAVVCEAELNKTLAEVATAQAMQECTDLSSDSESA